jgi:hypothetical protein
VIEWRLEHSESHLMLDAVFDKLRLHVPLLSKHHRGAIGPLGGKIEYGEGLKERMCYRLIDATLYFSPHDFLLMRLDARHLSRPMEAILDSALYQRNRELGAKPNSRQLASFDLSDPDSMERIVSWWTDRIALKNFLLGRT